MDDSAVIPDAYDESQQAEFTQTQTQTQQTQSSQPSFPSHLWGLLVSCSPAPNPTQLVQLQKENAESGEEYVDRPARIELIRGENGNECLIGRYPKANIILNGKKISSKHARMWVKGGEEGVRLEDTSTNGTFVRGRRVGKGKVTLVEHGDEIIFGPTSNNFVNDFRYIFQAPSTAQPVEKDGIHAFYDVREQIGKGSFATVKKGIQRSSGKMVAIKIIQKARFASNPKTMEMIKREVDIMKALDHKYCVQYIDYFEDEHKMWLVLEYVDGGDVLDYIMKRTGLKENETREIALMVCEAVAYLHSKGIAHRDLKPENLLLTKGTRPLCKVTDFGLAKMVDNNTMLKTACGTPSYLAPEVILNANPAAGYKNAVDAWSIGVVLYSCLTNATPFDESESTPLPQRMAERSVDFGYMRELGVSEIAIDFMSKLLVNDPLDRMSVKDALEHPWLATTSTNGVSTRAQPLLVSSLPFNSGVDSPRVAMNADTPSVTSPGGVSYEDSFNYSQKLDNLRLGTPGRSMQSASQTTPDRTLEDEQQPTEPGDVSFVGLPTPQIPEDCTIADSVSTSPTSHKRKQPASAFSSSSSNEQDATPQVRAAVHSPMQVDGGSAAPSPAATNVEEVDEAEAEAEVEAEAEEEGPETTTRRRRTSTTAKGKGTPGGRRRSNKVAVASSPPVEDVASVDTGLAGPVTRRRAKAARLS